MLLDGVDLFPGGVLVNLSTLLTLTNGNAYVGFTAATGGGDDNQDILSWTFMPNAQSQVVTANALTTFNFQNSIYNFTAQQTPTDPPVVVEVTPMTMTASGYPTPWCRGTSGQPAALSTSPLQVRVGMHP